MQKFMTQQWVIAAENDCIVLFSKVCNHTHPTAGCGLMLGKQLAEQIEQIVLIISLT